MSKRAISLTLSEENLLWLRGRAGQGRGTLSATVDDLVSEARRGRLGRSAPPRSVVGTVDLAAHDPELAGADRMVRDLFAASVSRPFIVRESQEPYRVRPGRRRRKGRG